MMKTFTIPIASVGLALASMSGAASAQQYADVNVPGTIEVVVAYAAGGGSDILVRTALPYMEAAIEELTGQRPNMVVRNVPGAGGEVGWVAMAQASPDGSTIGLINLPAIGLVEAARDTDYAPWVETFVPIGVNVIDPNILVANDAAPGGSIQGAIEAARNEPGSVTVGADGPLSDDHLAVYALEAATGAKFTFIPYSGGAPAVRAFLSREVDLMMGNVSDYVNAADSAVDSMILSDSRYELVPDVPSAQEAADLDLSGYGSTRGWAVRAGIPDDLLTVYREAFGIAMSQPDYIAEANERQLTLVEPMVGDAFGDLMRQTGQSVQDLLHVFQEGGYLE